MEAEFKPGNVCYRKRVYTMGKCGEDTRVRGVVYNHLEDGFGEDGLIKAKQKV